MPCCHYPAWQDIRREVGSALVYEVQRTAKTNWRSNMGIFFTSSRPVASTIESALEDGLSTDPTTLRANLRTEAAARAHSVAKTAAPQFKLRNFIGALLISAALLI